MIRRRVNTIFSAGKLGLLDRVLGLMNPGALVKRGQNRLAELYINQHLKRAAYKSAETTRLNEHWSSSNEDINTILYRELDKMRARSRWLMRNNPHAMGMMNAYISHIVATGLTLQCRVSRLIQAKDPDGNPILESLEMDSWNDFVEAKFNEWAEFADARSTELLPESFIDDQELFLRRLIEDGEVFVFLGTDTSLPGVPLRLMFIEPDSLDLSLSKSGGNPVVMGVELDEQTFRPLAYHIKQGTTEAGLYQTQGKTIRIEANRMLHVFKRLRPKQVRGIPHMAVVMQKFFDLDEWTDAELLGNKIAACFGVMIELPNSDGTPGALGEEDSSKATDANGNQLSTVEPGVIGYLPEGAKVNVVSPQKPGATFEMFAKYNIKAIGAGTLGGISYPAMTRDTSGQTFAGGRLSQNMDYQAFRPFQEFVARKFCIPVYRRWLAMAVLSRTVIAPGYFDNAKFWESCEFMPPGWAHGVNPLQEVNASIKSMEAGITNLADETAFHGKDWKRQLRLAGKIKRMADSLGLTLQGVNKSAQEIKAEQVQALDPEETELLQEQNQ
jgi:lambda family phage portal protein